MRNAKRYGVGQWFAGTKIASVTGMGTARYYDADAMATAITVRGGPKFNLRAADSVRPDIGRVWTNPYVAIADVLAAPVWRDVAEDQEKIGMLETRAKKQLRGHRADNFEARGERFAGERQNVRTIFEL